MASRPPGRGGRGTNILMLLILLLVVGGGLAWAFLRNPPGAPSPSSTATPTAEPSGQPSQ